MEVNYPRFAKIPKGRQTGLICALSKNKCFVLSYNEGSRGDGFEFRIYKSRSVCIKHEKAGYEIPFNEFKLILSNVFADYIGEISYSLPSGFLKQSSEPKQIAE